RPKPDDDRTIAMSANWHAAYEQFEEAVAVASEREQAFFEATPERRAEAKRVAVAAARVRDHRTDKLQVLADAIFRTKARTLEGVAAKFTVAMRDCEPSPTDPIPPWPYLRSIQADLDRLIAAAKP
ncbi:MAG: hypothetical protein JWM77_3203, partial [Rhodospirillales bacterium]|nr:hypothetical protein [Rhodospirillales bacterium]